MACQLYYKIFSTKPPILPHVNMQKKTKKVEQVEIMIFISNQCLIRLSGIGTDVTRQGKNEFWLQRAQDNILMQKNVFLRIRRNYKVSRYHSYLLIWHTPVQNYFIFHIFIVFKCLYRIEILELYLHDIGILSISFLNCQCS